MSFNFIVTLIVFFASTIGCTGQNDSIDNRLLGNYFFYKNDYESSILYYSKSPSYNSYDYSLEIESFIQLSKIEEAKKHLRNYIKKGYNPSSLYSNPTIWKFISDYNLLEDLNKSYSENSTDKLAQEIYHLLMTDQLVRTGYISENIWSLIDTSYILPRLLTYLATLDTISLIKQEYLSGLKVILLHQVRYKNGYNKLKYYIEKLYQTKAITPYDYANLIDEYYIVFNKGVQMYGTCIIPMGRTTLINVIDPLNIDKIRAQISLPPLYMDFNYLKQNLGLPQWYLNQLNK